MSKLVRMKSWPRPALPSWSAHPELSALRRPEIKLFDTASGTLRALPAPDPQHPTGLYVCGITPYDATHIGHAATYLVFDAIHRLLLVGGHTVSFIQNVTDVDDPLFERALRDHVDWEELGQSQIELFRSDMTHLSVIPPEEYVSVSESVHEVIDVVEELLRCGAAYTVDDARYPDIYASINATQQFGYVSGLSREEMLPLFSERGGDPQRPGKRHPLDALVWRVARPGEPSWESPFGRGRPGWHVECSAIASHRLSDNFVIQGGGSDLIFPHHEFSAAHYEATQNVRRMAHHYVHTGMMAYEGTKMSKSLGNLVFVSTLLAEGADPSALRLGLYASHYRTDREWSTDVLTHATHRLERFRTAVMRATNTPQALRCISAVHTALCNDLDTPGALAIMDAWAADVVMHNADARLDSAGMLVADALDTLLGIKLFPAHSSRVL